MMLHHEVAAAVAGILSCAAAVPILAMTVATSIQGRREPWSRGWLRARRVRHTTRSATMPAYLVVVATYVAAASPWFVVAWMVIAAMGFQAVRTNRRLELVEQKLRLRRMERSIADLEAWLDAERMWRDGQ